MSDIGEAPVDVHGEPQPLVLECWTPMSGGSWSYVAGQIPAGVTRWRVSPGVRANWEWWLHAPDAPVARNRLTEGNAQRLADAFTAKAFRFLYGDDARIDAENLRGIILTVIADTELVLTGAIQIEDFEKAT